VRSIDSISNSRWYCFTSRVLGLGENELKGRLVEILERGDDGQSADEFRDQDIFQKVVRLNLAENSDIIAMTEFDRTGT
jgi:hypothetical protein